MDIDLTGKRALVCGASKGIGRAAAEELAKLGASVTVLSRSEDKLQAVRDGLPTDKGQKHQVLAVDVSDSDALRERVEHSLTAHGPVHVLVNNSGGPPGGPGHQAGTEEFTRAFQQHLVANQVLVQTVLEGMKSEGYGRVINVISTSVKQPLHGLGVSNTIRGAVANWGKTLANELGGFGITVNNVLPGATDTDRLTEIFTNKAKKTGQTLEQVREGAKATIPAGRFARPEELGQAIAFLASPAAAYINGINLPVDGGRTGCL